MSSKQSTSGPSAKKRKLDDESFGPEQKSFGPVIVQKWHNAWHENQSKHEKQKQLDDAHRLIKLAADIEQANNKEINDLKLKLAQEQIKTEQADEITKSVICKMVTAGRKKREQNDRICEKDLLTECVYTNNPAAMSLLIKYKNKFEGVALEAYDERAESRTFYSNALYLTARTGNLECMKLLLQDGGLSSKIRNKNLQRQQNVLFDLVKFKNKHDWQSHKRFLICKTNYAWKDLEQMVWAILSCDPEKNIIDDHDINGMTVLHHAAREKNLNSVNFTDSLCFFSKNSNHTTNLKTSTYYDLPDQNNIFYNPFERGYLHFRQTPLHMAMRARKWEGLMLLAPVNKSYSISRAHQKLMKTSACELPQNQEKIVNILLEHGADPKLGDQFQNNFLHYAAACGLVKKYADSMLLFESVLKEKVVPFGGDGFSSKVLFVNKTNEFGDTPLIFGLQLVWDHDEDLMLETVKKLHENGADLNHKNNFGYSALLISKMRNLKKITEFLESNGAVIDLDKHLLLKIVKSYGFDKYGCVHNQRSVLTVKSTCEYLRKLARMDLGRFSEEYNYGSKYCHFTYFDDDTDLSKFKIRVKRFSSLKSISEFITTDPELKQRYVMEFGNGRIFKEDVCLICLTDAPERTFLPCGHEAICKDCLAMSDFKKCPLCKQKIEIVL